MTYFGFLLRFLVLPILVFLAIAWWDQKNNRPARGFRNGRAVWVAILVHTLLAVTYTTPWDNYLVATGVWYYNPRLVTGIVFGYVPLEEYTFFILETLLTGLWWWFLARRLPKPAHFTPSKPARVIASILLSGVWVYFTWLFFSGNAPFTYLAITLFWALPAIFPQLLFGADILWHRRWLVILTVVIPGAYLSLTDIAALQATTWSIAPAQTTGLLFFGVLPLEEVVFFFITNILVGFGMTLLLSEHGQKRIADWKSNNFKGLP